MFYILNGRDLNELKWTDSKFVETNLTVGWSQELKSFATVFVCCLWIRIQHLFSFFQQSLKFIFAKSTYCFNYFRFNSIHDWLTVRLLRNIFLNLLVFKLLSLTLILVYVKKFSNLYCIWKRQWSIDFC